MKKTFLIPTLYGLLISSMVATPSFGQETIRDAKKKAEELGPKEVLLGEGDLLKGIPGEGDLTPKEIRDWLKNPEVHRVIRPILPLGLAAGASQIKGIDETPMTQAKIELGRQLYFDPRLSSDSTISCASCHHPDQGYSHTTRFGVGVQGQEGNRNSPISYNRILSDLQFWDGRALTLEEQAVGPIANPVEMGNNHDACVATLQEIPGYKIQFAAVFGKDGLNIDNVAKALATFERAIVTGPSAYDFSEAMAQYQKIDQDDLKDLLEDDETIAAQYETIKKGSEALPMSESALRGQKLFFSERVNCAACHVGANLTDEKYHNLGVGIDAEEPDLGRYVVTKDEKDWGAFKTPTVRNVALSPPYMHDGSQKTLMEVVEHYNKGGNPNKNLSDKIVKLNLKDQEKKDLVAFMEALTGSFPKVEHGRLPK